MITITDLLVHAGFTLGVMSLTGMLVSGVALWRQHRRGGAR